VGDLQPALGVQLLLEVAGERRGDVEAQVPAGLVAADPAALEQEARGDRPGRNDDGVGPHANRAPVGQRAPHGVRLPVGSLEALGAALGQNAHAVGAELRLRPR
jgi:hypothetical protein